MNPVNIIAIAVVLGVMLIPSGCIYNNAERQAKDIKACESVGARWYYSSVTKQVNCSPKPKNCATE